MSELPSTYLDFILTPGWQSYTTVVCAATDHVWVGTETFEDDLDVGSILATSDAVAGRTVVGGVANCTSPIVFQAAGQTPGTADVFIFLDRTPADPAANRILCVLESDITGIPYNVAGAQFQLVVENGELFEIVG